jgi:class 3 adenylate cyclase
VELENIKATSAPKPPAALTRLPLTEAVLVMDICGSTELARLHGDRVMLRLKRALKEIVERAAQDNRVKFMKGTGDGFLMTFAECDEAAQTALRVLDETRRLNSEQPGQPALGLRFGLDYGEVYAEADGDRSGGAVNLAFRVEGTQAAQMHETSSGLYHKEGLPERDRILVTHNVFKRLGLAGPRLQCLKAGYFDYKGFEGMRVAVYVVHAGARLA